MVVSFSGSPPRLPGPKFRVMPVRRPNRPVSKPARLGVQTEAATWKSVSRSPPAATLSRFGVRPDVSFQFAPRSPYPQSAGRNTRTGCEHGRAHKLHAGQRQTYHHQRR